MSQVKRKFKVLILDCDGTIVPYRVDALPSQKVSDAISKVNRIIHIGIATSRPLIFASSIMKHLKLSGPSIVAGGAQIVDGETLKILKEQQILKNDLLTASAIFKKYNINYLAQDGIGKDKELTPNLIPEKAIQMAVIGIEPSMADKLADELSSISGISTHKTTSWQPNKTDIVITHVSATKHHGVLEVARLLNIDTHEIIGVGDGYNDFPLLMACGLKVAMGNAVEDLKAIADYIAPSVDDDGVVDVINKFIL